MLDWKKAEKKKAHFFAWKEVRAAWQQMDAQVARLSIEMAMEDFRKEARACPGCRRAPGRLLWISIGTSEKEWARGDERCGWVTVCEACSRQVQFLLDEEMTESRREGNW